MPYTSDPSVRALTMRAGECVTWLAVAWFLSGPTCVGVVAQEPTTRAPVAAAFADWQTRQKAMKTARYVLSGTSEFLEPLTPDSPAAPKGDRGQPYQATVLLDLERKRFRSESSEAFPTVSGKFETRVGTVAYNGVEVRQGQPRELAKANGGFDVLIAKGARDGQEGSPVRDLYWPLLFAHGIVPTTHQPAYVDRLPYSISLEDFVSRGHHTLRGDDCQVFQTQPLFGMKGISDEYWVRPDRLSAITRYVYLSDGEPWFRMEIEWADSAIGWMPRSWTHVLTTDGKNVKRRYSLRIEHFEANPSVSDEDFTIPVTPGMKRVIVTEEPPAGLQTQAGFPGRRTYRISDDGTWVEMAWEGWQDAEGRTIPLSSHRNPLGRLIGIAIVVLFGGYVIFRRRCRRSVPTPPLPPS